MRKQGLCNWEALRIVSIMLSILSFLTFHGKEPLKRSILGAKCYWKISVSSGPWEQNGASSTRPVSLELLQQQDADREPGLGSGRKGTEPVGQQQEMR